MGNVREVEEMSFIGRGEVIASKILRVLVPCVGIKQQVNIQDIALPEQFALLDQEIKNHNFDLMICRNSEPDIVVEINYKHKERAAQKYRQIFGPLVRDAGLEFLEINDWDCRKRGLFWLNSKREHLAITWTDYQDVIDALNLAGINPHLKIE